MQASVEQPPEVPDVGPIVAESVHTFFRQPHNLEAVQQLREAGVRWPDLQALASDVPRPCWARPWC